LSQVPAGGIMTPMSRDGFLRACLAAVLVVSCTRPTEERTGLYLGPPGTTQTHALVTVQGGDLAADAWRLHSQAWLGDRHSQTYLPEGEPSGPLAFPTSYVVVAPDGSGELVLEVEALARDGSVVGRATGRVTLVRQRGVGAELTLGRPCNTPADCQDGSFCNGAETCVERVCFPAPPAEIPCPASPHACVQVTCLEDALACSVRADHGSCAPLSTDAGTEPTYCDALYGCVRGQPCTVAADCQDGLVCNGQERCIGGRCVPGIPPGTQDDNACTVDACVEGSGPTHFPAPDGNRCPLGGDDGICLAGRCLPSTCGDGFVDTRAGESCDNGTDNSDDTPNSCRRDCRPARCGDGVRDQAEECDDGLDPTNPACLDGCVRNVCGDRVVNPATEQCDDGNDVDEDGCTNGCRENVCGDGILDPATEECDDANTVASDDCTSLCSVARCGDGILHAGVEGCDGPQPGGERCRFDCTKVERCGDGFVDTQEECDDGNVNPNDGCDACHLMRWSARVVLGFGDGGGKPLQVRLGLPNGLAVDVLGNVFVTDDVNERVWRIDAVTNLVTLVAGDGNEAFSGDGQPATTASTDSVAGVAVDALGNVFLADGRNNRVRVVDATGTMRTVAGDGVDGFGGDNGPAVAASLSWPVDVAVDGLGNLFIADGQNSRIRRVDTQGVITTYAGTGVPGATGDGGPATQARLAHPVRVLLDDGGNLYIADRMAHRVRRVDASGTIRAVAGTGIPGFWGDGGAATLARLSEPDALALDRGGNLYIGDLGNARVRRVGVDGRITTVAGNGHMSGGQVARDGAAATEVALGQPRSLAVDAQGRLLVGEHETGCVYRVYVGGTISRFFGRGEGFDVAGTALAAGDGGRATSAKLGWPVQVAAGPDGSVLYADWFSEKIRSVDPDGILHDVAARGTANTNLSWMPFDLALDSHGTAHFSGMGRVVRVLPDGDTEAVAGALHTMGSSGDDVPALQAKFGWRMALAFTAGDELYVCDTENSRVRRVDSLGYVRGVAGTGLPGFGGDNGPAHAALLHFPRSIAFDRDGTLLVSDSGNHRVRRVDLDGTITTVAGTGIPGFSGDQGPATAARLQDPWGITVDGLGRLWIADYGNHRIRRVETDGTITTVVGSGVADFGGDGGPAAAGSLAGPSGLAVLADGTVFFGDSGNSATRVSAFSFEFIHTVVNYVRRVAPDGTLTTVAGWVFPGDGPFEDAALGAPLAVTPFLDRGWLVADGLAGRVRWARTDREELRTVAGYRNGFPDELNPGGGARYSRLLRHAAGIAYDEDSRTAYVTEEEGHVLRALHVVNLEDPATWTVETASGALGVAAHVDGSMANARFSRPAGLALDAARRRLYVAEVGNHDVRVVDLAARTVSTVSGNARRRGYFGDGVPAREALFNGPRALALGGDGSLYVADTGNHRVRRISPDGVVTLVLGDGTPSSAGMGSPARFFPADTPGGLAVDGFGNLFVSSRTSVRLVSAGDDGVVTGEDHVSTLYGAAPRTAFPEPVTRCLAGLGVGPGSASAVVVDECQGFMVELRPVRVHAGGVP
jgi:cysteine-rich repeat protein